MPRTRCRVPDTFSDRLSLLERNMEPVYLELDAVQALVHGDVQSLALLTDAEAAVAWDALRLFGAGLRRAGGNAGHFLPGRINNEDAGTRLSAGRQINVPLHIHGHAVGAVFLPEIHQRVSFPVHQAVVSQGKGVDLHGT